jgi:hypothetical protein
VFFYSSTFYNIFKSEESAPAATVDAMLLGKKPRCEYRKIDTDGGYGINDGSGTESDSEEQERESSASYRRRTEQSDGKRYQASVEVSSRNVFD